MVAPDGDAFRVITGDYVTTEDGTGIVHIAPTFGADDDRVAKQSGIPPLVVVDRAGKRQPMVDRTGKFFRLEDLDPEFVRTHVDAAAYGEFAGRFVKNAYDPTLSEADPTLDVDLCMSSSSRARRSASRSIRTTIPIAGVPTSLCCTIRSTRGLSARRPSRTA